MSAQVDPTIIPGPRETLYVGRMALLLLPFLNLMLGSVGVCWHKQIASKRAPSIMLSYPVKRCVASCDSGEASLLEVGTENDEVGQKPGNSPQKHNGFVFRRNQHSRGGTLSEHAKRHKPKAEPILQDSQR